MNLSDNEIELLRRLVADRVVYLQELTGWAKLTGMAQQMEKLPLLKQLADKLGEPDYTKQIYGENGPLY